MRDTQEIFSGMAVGILILLIGIIVGSMMNDKMTIEQCLKTTAVLQTNKEEL